MARMNDILEELVPQKQEENYFSKLSFAFSLITLAFLLYLVKQVPSVSTPTQRFRPIPKWIIVAMHFSCYLGLLFTILSFIKREKSKYLKVAGAILNFLLFAIIFGLVIFAKIVGKG